MDYLESLEKVVKQTKHERYRSLCAEDHLDHAVWRQRVIALASGVVEPNRVAIPVRSPFARVLPPCGTVPVRRLVVSRFTEDLAWLDMVDSSIEVVSYNKGNYLDGTVPLANHGREAGTYLYHIIEYYDRLADVTIFSQGDPLDHSPDFIERLTLPYDQPTTLTTRYLTDLPPDWIKERDLVGTHHGYPVRYGDALIANHGDGTDDKSWFDRSAWDYVFDCDMPVPLWFGYAATWAVPRDSIRSRPLGFYQDLYSVLDSGESKQSRTAPPGINAWSLEALWRAIWLGPDVYPHRWKPRKPCGACGKAVGDLLRSAMRK